MQAKAVAVGLGLSLAVVLGACKSHMKDPPQPEVAQDVSPDAHPATTTPPGDGEASAKPVRTAPEARGEDVLEEVRTWGTAKYAQPAGKFRSAGVRKVKVDEKTVENVGGGFRVRFTSGSQVATPAVYKGMLFVSGGFSSHELYAFDAKSGKPAWALQLDDDGPSAPACANDVCVVNTESCTLFVVNAKTGALLWAKWLGDPLMSAPTIDGDLVYASYPVSQTVGKKSRPQGASHALAAFELKTGKVVWQRWIDGDVQSSPVAVDDSIWASTFGGTVFEFDKKTGKVLTARRSQATSAPVVASNGLYYSVRADDGDMAGEAIAGQTKTGASFLAAKKHARYLDKTVQRQATLAVKGTSQDAANGFAGGAPASAKAEDAADLVGQQSVSTLQSHQGSRVLAFRDQNIASMGNEIVSTDSKTGKKLWSHKLEGDEAAEGGFLAAPPVAAGGWIIVGTLKGEILKLDPKNGKIVQRWKVDAPIRTQPIVQDGWIYAGTADGRLMAVDSGDPTLTGWSQWGGDARRNSVRK